LALYNEQRKSTKLIRTYDARHNNVIDHRVSHPEVPYNRVTKDGALDDILTSLREQHRFALLDERASAVSMGIQMTKSAY